MISTPGMAEAQSVKAHGKKPEKINNKSVESGDQQFSSLLGHWHSIQGEGAKDQKVEPKSPDKNIAKKSVKSGKKIIFLIKQLAGDVSPGSRSPGSGRLKGKVIFNKRVNPAPEQKTEKQQKKGFQGGNIHNRRRASFFHNSLLRNGKKIYLRTLGSVKYTGTAKKNSVNSFKEKIKNKKYVKIKGYGKRKNIGFGEKYDTVTIKSKNAAEQFLSDDLKEARDSSGSKRAAQGGREFSFACLKYENNIPNTVTKLDYQIHRSADEIFNDIVKQFSMVVKKGGGEAKVVLQPEVLGQVKLSLKLYNNEVNTFMVVDNQAVKELIMSRLNILEQNLLEQGFSLGSFEVEVKDRNTEPETAGKDVKKGPGINNIEDEDQDLEISRASMSGLPWISTVVNITV